MIKAQIYNFISEQTSFLSIILKKLDGKTVVPPPSRIKEDIFYVPKTSATFRLGQAFLTPGKSL